MKFIGKYNENIYDFSQKSQLNSSGECNKMYVLRILKIPISRVGYHLLRDIWYLSTLNFLLFSFCTKRINPRCRSSSLHAKWVSWVYQSGNKYKNFENQVMNTFMDVSIGKQKIKNMKNIVF